MALFPEFTTKGRVVFIQNTENSVRHALCVLDEYVDSAPEDKETPAQMVARALHNLFHPDDVR